MRPDYLCKNVLMHVFGETVEGVIVQTAQDQSVEPEGSMSTVLPARQASGRVHSLTAPNSLQAAEINQMLYFCFEVFLIQ